MNVYHLLEGTFATVAVYFALQILLAWYEWMKPGHHSEERQAKAKRRVRLGSIVGAVVFCIGYALFRLFA